MKRESCCCGATKSSPCACMKKGVMNCSKSEPKCPCYKDKDLKKSVEKKRFITYPTCAHSMCLAKVDAQGQYCASHQGMAKAFAMGWSLVKNEPRPVSDHECPECNGRGLIIQEENGRLNFACGECGYMERIKDLDIEGMENLHTTGGDCPLCGQDIGDVTIDTYSDFDRYGPNIDEAYQERDFDIEPLDYDKLTEGKEECPFCSKPINH